MINKGNIVYETYWGTLASFDLTFNIKQNMNNLDNLDNLNNIHKYKIS